MAAITTTLDEVQQIQMASRLFCNPDWPLVPFLLAQYEDAVIDGIRSGDNVGANVALLQAISNLRQSIVTSAQSLGAPDPFPGE